MRLLRKFFGRSWADKVLLVRALGLVGSVRIGLWMLPYQKVRRLVDQPLRMTPLYPPFSPEAVAYHRRVVAAVEAIGRRVLGDTPCLTQALVAQRLLRQAGYETELHIGVTKREGELLAHAWLEQDDIIVIGGSRSRQRYAPLVRPETL